MTKKAFAFSVLALLCAGSVQALDTSVKPVVTELGVTPQSYMLVGNSFTFYSCGMHNMINRLAKEGGFKIRRNRMVTIGGADLGWFNVWDLLRPTGMASTYVDHSDGNKIKTYDFTKEKIFDVVVLQDNSKGPIDPQRKDIFQKYLKVHSTDMSVLGIKPMVMMTWAWEGKPERLRNGRISSSIGRITSIRPPQVRILRAVSRTRRCSRPLRKGTSSLAWILWTRRRQSSFRESLGAPLKNSSGGNKE